MNDYKKAFNYTKPSRTLFWIPNEGTVTLEIERDHAEPITLDVSPIQATVISLFENKGKGLLIQDEIKIQELAEMTKCSLEVIKDSVQFWHTYKLLELCGDTVISLEKASEERKQQLNSQQMDHYENDNSSSKLKCSGDSIWPMVRGMLTNLGPSHSTNIHKTLVMFSSDDCHFNIDELECILEYFVQSDKLICEDKKYSIKKD